MRFAAGLTFVVLAFGLTFNLTDVVQRAVPDYTSRINDAIAGPGLPGGHGPSGSRELRSCAEEPASVLLDCGAAPEISGIQQWLNTPGNAPLTKESLAGKVVLVDFWAYSCINCQRAIEHVDAWYGNYRSDGLVVIGVHTPEYAFERVPGNVAAGARRLGVDYPVALDNSYATWDNFGNQAWPTQYLIDAHGKVRHVAVGEGGYAGTESLIRRLLTDARPGTALPPPTDVPDDTPTDGRQTPEIPLGAGRSAAVVNGPVTTGTGEFGRPETLLPGQAALTGAWDAGEEAITSGRNAGITLDFFARDVYLDVGGTGTVTATLDGRTSTFTVSGAPGIHRVVTGSSSRQGVLTLKLSPGLSAYSFTFG